MTLILGTFAGVLAIVLGAFWLFVMRQEATEHKALQKRLRPHEEAAKRTGLTLAKVDHRRAEAFKGLQSVIDQSGKRMTVPGLLFACVMSGFLGGVTVFAIIGHLAAAAVVGLLALLVPYWFVKRAASSRMWK